MLFSGSSQTISAQKISNGTKCSKPGKVMTKSGQTFVCIKSGNRFVWRVQKTSQPAQPVKSLYPSPSTSAAPTPGLTSIPEPSSKESVSPIPTPIPSRSLRPLGPDEIAAQEIYAAFQKPVSQSSLFEFHFSPNTNRESELTSSLIQDLFRSQRYWEGLGVTFDEKIQVAFTTERDQVWWNDLKPSIGVKRDDNYVFENFRTQPYMGYAGASNQTEYSQSGLHIFFFISSEIRDESDIYWAKVMAPHEFVHLVQFQLTPGRIMGRYACWYIEGLARFYERATQFDNRYPIGFSYRKFKKDELNYFAYSVSKQDSSQQVSNWKISDYLEFLSKNQAPSSDACITLKYGYSLGWPLSEKFYIDFGPERFVALLESIGVTKDWEQSFLKVTGQSHQDWLRNSAIPYLIEQSRSN